MNEIDFRLEKAPESSGELVVRILVDGADLALLARAVEMPFAAAEGWPDIAGKYIGLCPKDVVQSAAHFLGEAAPLFQYGRKVQVLGCTCGEPGCWPLVCEIAVDTEEVTWKNFEQPHRGEDQGQPSWSHEALGPFVFARPRYDKALRRVVESAA